MMILIWCVRPTILSDSTAMNRDNRKTNIINQLRTGIWFQYASIIIQYRHFISWTWTIGSAFISHGRHIPNEIFMLASILRNLPTVPIMIFVTNFNTYRNTSPTFHKNRKYFIGINTLSQGYGQWDDELFHQRDAFPMRYLCWHRCSDAYPQCRYLWLISIHIQ